MLARLGPSQPAQSADVIARTMGALALITLAVIHVVDLPGTLGPTPLVGIGYLGIIVAALGVGGVLVARSHWLVWAAGGAVAVMAMGGYVLTRALPGGFLGDHGDVGNWRCPLGIAALSVETLIILLVVLAAYHRRPDRSASDDVNSSWFLSVLVERSRSAAAASHAAGRREDQVANTRHDRAGGKSAGPRQGPQARRRARERIAAERAARKRAEARRRFLAAIGAVAAVLAVVVTLVAVKVTSAPARLVASESPAPSVVVRQVTAVPAAVLARMSPGQAITPLQAVKASGPPLSIGGKPAIVFVSEESCPFCAAERWSVAVALSRFGTWSHLGSTTSSATDVYPNTATLSFRTAVYRSTELTLRTTELADNAGRPLQAQTQLDTRLIDAFDVPPYVNSADQSGAVPFLDIANRYILAGAQYNPQVLAGLSAAQIAGQLSNPASPVASAIDGSAQVIIAAIDQVRHDKTSPPLATGVSGG